MPPFPSRKRGAFSGQRRDVVKDFLPEANLATKHPRAKAKASEYIPPAAAVRLFSGQQGQREAKAVGFMCRRLAFRCGPAASESAEDLKEIGRPLWIGRFR
ncbi:hypothetical protein TRVL_02402 [Trypanosoma vivax]|nr:hypothetical protein TRVL_02402 [Trypanosoma vivax]